MALVADVGAGDMEDVVILPSLGVAGMMGRAVRGVMEGRMI